MKSTFPAFINEAGQRHVADELKRLGLDWDVQATCSDIEGKIGFQNLVAGEGDRTDYEIRNLEVGISSYGVFGHIEILADRHIQFEQFDD